MLVPINKGAIASFRFVPKNLGSWFFLQVGVCKLGGLCHLSDGAGEFGSWCFL
jgi:hypothetical protein